MDLLKKQIEYLETFATPDRVNLLAEKLALRTRYITVCVEDLFQPQNTSAVLRSCEAFGVQDIHIVENTNHSRIYPDVALGTDKWLTIHRYSEMALPLEDSKKKRPRKNQIQVEEAPLDMEPCALVQQGNNASQLALEKLRQKGYRIVATAPDKEAGVSLEQFDLTKGPVAMMFGTERTGLSKSMMAEADEFLYLPMAGFVESLNVSVAVAVTLYTLSTKLRQSIIHWQLRADEKEELMFRWLMQSVRSSDDILQRFINSQ